MQPTCTSIRHRSDLCLCEAQGCHMSKAEGPGLNCEQEILTQGPVHEPRGTSPHVPHKRGMQDTLHGPGAFGAEVPPTCRMHICTSVPMCAQHMKCTSVSVHTQCIGVGYLLVHAPSVWGARVSLCAQRTSAQRNPCTPSAQSMQGCLASGRPAEFLIPLVLLPASYARCKVNPTSKQCKVNPTSKHGRKTKFFKPNSFLIDRWSDDRDG